MKNTKKNIRFNYEYRDAGNYKRFGSVVLSNPHYLTNLGVLEREIRSCLFDEEFFYPINLSIPSIHFEKWVLRLDHDWYRFESLEFTNESNTDIRTIESFLLDIKMFAKETII